MMKYDSNDGKNNSCDHNDYFGNYCANNNNGYGWHNADTYVININENDNIDSRGKYDNYPNIF